MSTECLRRTAGMTRTTVTSRPLLRKSRLSHHSSPFHLKAPPLARSVETVSPRWSNTWLWLLMAVGLVVVLQMSI